MNLVATASDQRVLCRLLCRLHLLVSEIAAGTHASDGCHSHNM